MKYFDTVFVELYFSHLLDREVILGAIYKKEIDICERISAYIRELAVFAHELTFILNVCIYMYFYP